MSLIEWVKWDFKDIEDPHYKNELKANKALGIILFFISVVGLIFLILQGCNVFQLEKHTEMVIFYSITIVFSLSGFLLAVATEGREKCVKYILLLDLTVLAALSDMFLGFYAVLIIALPIIGASRYANKKLTIWMAAILAGFIIIDSFLAHFTNVRLDINIVDNNVAIQYMLTGDIPYWEYTNSYLVLNLLPKLLIFSVISLFCVMNSSSIAEYNMDAANSIKKEERINGELTLAKDIQKSMLPSVFPPFPNVKNFDIYADMVPAKEVGGDLYDFFLLDDQHLGMVVADVSGKGIPASMFMGMAKILFKNMLIEYDKMSIAISKVNDILCDSNPVNLFVTAWIGVLDLNSGVLTYVNAGHNPPMLIKDGKISLLNELSGIALGCMPHKIYKSYSVQLSPKDRVFLYTDGITEATNESNELYGEDRLKTYLSNNIDKDDETLVDNLLTEVNSFQGSREQFDDITMVSMTFNSYLDKKNLRKEFVAKVENFDKVSEFIEESLSQFDVSLKYINQINIAVEEIFTNIAKYGFKNTGEGKATVDITYCNQVVTITTLDDSPKFDPFNRKDPDITLSADDREIGGLGLLMVKKLMDEVSYKYVDNTNIITLIKKVY